MSNKIKNFSEESLKEACKDYTSIASASRALKISRITLSKWLKNFNLKIIRGRKPIILNDIQLQVLNGALLGDGHLDKKKVGNSQFKYATSDENHTRYIASYFVGILTNETKDIKKAQYLDKRTNKIYTRYTMRTEDNRTFSGMRSKWYPNGIKIIPSNIKLTKLTCLIWFIGDGSINKFKNSCYIKLATHCFTLKDIKDVLMPQLSKFHPVVYCGDKKNQFFICIPRRYCKNFYDFIGKSPILSLNYKWDYLPYKNKKWKNGLTKNCLQYKQKMIKLFNEGYSYYKIAKILKLEAADVRYHLIQENIYPRK